MATRTLTHDVPVTPDKHVIGSRPTPAKVDAPDSEREDVFTALVLQAAKDVCGGKQGAVAAQLGKAEGNYSRDGKAGRLTTRQLSDLGRPFLARLGKLLREEPGAADSPDVEVALDLDAAEEAIRRVKRRLLKSA